MQFHMNALKASGELEGAKVSASSFVEDFECVLGGDANIDFATRGLVSTGKCDMGPRLQSVLDAVRACFDCDNPGKCGDGVFVFKFATGKAAGGCVSMDFARRFGSGHFISIPLDSTVFMTACDNDDWPPMRPVKPFRILRLAGHIDKVRSKSSGGATTAYVCFVKTADGLNKGFEQRAIDDVRARAARVTGMMNLCNAEIESKLKQYDNADPTGWVGVTFAKQAEKPGEDVSQLRTLLSELVGARQVPQPADPVREAAVTAMLNRDKKDRDARDLINRNLSDTDKELLLTLPKHKKPEEENVYVAIARMVGSRPNHCPLDKSWSFPTIGSINADAMMEIGGFHGWNTCRLFKQFMADARIKDVQHILFKQKGEVKLSEQSRAEIMTAIGELPDSERALAETAVGIACCRMVDFVILRDMMARKGIAKEETFLHVLQSDRALNTAWNLLNKRASLNESGDRRVEPPPPPPHRQWVRTLPGFGDYYDKVIKDAARDLRGRTLSRRRLKTPPSSSGADAARAAYRRRSGAKRGSRPFSAGDRRSAQWRRREASGSPLKILPAAQQGGGWSPHVPSRKSSGGGARGFTRKRKGRSPPPQFRPRPPASAASGKPKQGPAGGCYEVERLLGCVREVLGSADAVHNKLLAQVAGHLTSARHAVAFAFVWARDVTRLLLPEATRLGVDVEELQWWQFAEIDWNGSWDVEVARGLIRFAASAGGWATAAPGGKTFGYATIGVDISLAPARVRDLARAGWPAYRPDADHQ
eukprot:gene51191-56235_t